MEITESTIMADPTHALEILSRLNTMGVQIAIDDFGTGYSSMAHLKTLPVQELKVDRSFVSQMTSNSRDAVIVRSTVDLGRNLGLRVVAEGVEDVVTSQELDALGCDAIQGYSISRPVPPTTSSNGSRSTRQPSQAHNPTTIERRVTGSPSPGPFWCRIDPQHLLNIARTRHRPYERPGVLWQILAGTLRR